MTSDLHELAAADTTRWPAAVRSAAANAREAALDRPDAGTCQTLVGMGSRLAIKIPPYYARAVPQP